MRINFQAKKHKRIPIERFQKTKKLIQTRKKLTIKTISSYGR